MSHPHVTVEQGILRGCTLTTENGFSYSGFMGIPYAKPPIGELRFRDPQYPEKWEGVRDASFEGNMSPQENLMSTRDYQGSEDSLYLNVFVPKASKKGFKFPLMAVMVWIHGGAFVSGSGSKELYSPDYLVQAGVIVVSINYRLGPLGFLCLNTAEVPGNAGLKDQSFAIRWVYKNIHVFGGDVDRITIFGESAGGVSVHYQMMSPMSKGLFTNAIVQSGSALSCWANQTNPEKNAIDLAAKLGFNSTDTKSILAFLRQVPVENLIKAATKPLSAIDINLFVPIVEQTFPNVEAFLTVKPLELLMTGNYNRVPCIQGFTSQEGLLFLSNNYTVSTDLFKVDNLSNIDLRIPKLLKVNLPIAFDEDTLAYWVNQTEQFYFKNVSDIVDDYMNLLSDLVFVRDMIQSIKLQRKRDLVYCYKFRYHGSTIHTDIVYAEATHADELTYLFKRSSDLSKSDILTLKRMVTLWTNFAKFGNPTPKLSDIITTPWEPVGEDHLRCLEIGSELKLIYDPFAERMKFWSDLMKLYL